MWDWLEKHPEISIETDDDDADPIADSKHAGQRIFTSDERTWQVIAGHGVDHSRLPRRSFECLSVIAAHGPNGILQPALTQITGQDKRSVPGRTDALAANGYIVKLLAYDGRHKTSLLKLRKFAEADGTSKPVSTLERTRIYPEAPPTDAQEDKNNDDKTFDEVIQMLKENDGTVAIIDLCRAYKLRKNTAIKQHFLQSLDRLVECGCARKVRATVEASNNRFLECLQLVREPIEQDREVFTGRSSDSRTQTDDLDVSMQSPNDEVDQTVEDVEDESGSDYEPTEEITQSTQRIPPQWTPDIPQNNLIFNLIDKAGPAGISSMELHKQSMGSFWKKSLDDLLLHLTDVWQISQPSHLKHLSIVRDTEVKGRSAHFHFRTLPNFERAVELGLTAWEAVEGNPNDGPKRLGRPPKSSAPLGVDKFGFPRLDPRLFADQEGRASLAQCAEPAQKATSRLQASNNTPSKGGPRKTEKTPMTPSSASPSGRTKRKYTWKKNTGAADQANPPSVGVIRLPSGRKKRKDAGMPKKGRGSSLRSVSTAAVEDDELLDQDPEEVDCLVDLYGTVDAPESSGRKRSSSRARINDSPRARKARKVDKTSSTPPPRHNHGAESEPPAQRILAIDAGQGEFSHSRVSINSPRAVELRFENYNRPGRRPKAKVVVVKSERLNDLWCFNSDGPGLVAQPGRNLLAVEVDTLESDHEPPQKKSRLEDGGVQAFSMNKTSDDTPVDAPVIKKRRGRPPKRKFGDMFEPPQASGPVTPATDTMLRSDPGISAPETPRSIIAKFPLRRSLLERFKEQRHSKDASGGEWDGRPSRIVTMPLPQAIADAETSMQGLPPVRRSRRRSSSNSLTNATPSAVGTKPSLMVKLGISNSRSSINGQLLPWSDPLPIPDTPKAASRSTFGLNIVKPYVGLTRTRASQTAGLDQDSSSHHGVIHFIEERGYSDLVRDTSDNLTALIGDDQDIDDDTDGLSVLLPANNDDEEEYREKATPKAGTPRQGGFIHLRRANIVMDTMRKAGGVFPGDHEMWYPFVTAWQKTYPHLPDRRTIENVVNLLVKQKRLNRFSFTFEDKSGKTIQRHIITEPGIDPSSARAKEVQRSIIESYPFRHLPKQVHIAKNLRDRARQTPVTQGGTRATSADDAKDKDPTYTPIGTRTSRSGSTKRSRGGSVSFDLRTQTGATQTPQVTRTASFTPRSILKIKDDASDVQQPVNLEEDDFDSDDETDTSSDSDDDDNSVFEISPDQAAMQVSFGLERYRHKPTARPRARQGTRAMRTLKVASQVPIMEAKSPASPQSTATPSTPTPLNDRLIQVFHVPSGTFGTLFRPKSKAGRPRRQVAKYIDLTPSKSNDTFSVPQDLNDILKHATELGRKGPNPSDSRFFQFQNEVNRVKAWEAAMISDSPTMDTSVDPVFINHGLKQQHELATDPDMEFVIEFVDGSLKPFILDSERKKRSQTARRKSVGSNAATPTPTGSYVSPYGPPPSMPATYPEPWGSTVDQALSFVPYVPSHIRSLLPSDSAKPMQPAQTATDSPTLIPAATRKASRPHTYKTRKSASKRLTVDPADATSQFVDRDSDGDYRPGQAIPAKKKGSAKKLLYQTPRKQAIYNKFSPEDFKRLALAVALARVVCGGTGSLQVTNYEAVALALRSKHEIEDLKHYWQLPRKHGYDLAFAKKLQQAMYEPFLQAYENGELPRVAFNNLRNTDWPALLEWANATVLPTVEQGPLDKLPKERGDLQLMPTTTSLPTLEDANDHDTLASAPDPNSNQLAAPVRQRGHNLAKASTALDQNHILEKSWIRAVMVTKDEVYDENLAANRLGSVVPATLEKATQEMLSTKMIKWKKVDRQQPGRSYVISPYAMSQFDRWSRSHGKNFLGSLTAARTDFLRYFELHDQLELNVDVTEAQLSVLTNMVAQGHLMISPGLPERNDDFDAHGPKWSKWGPLKGVYDEEQAALPSLDIKVVYKKTPLIGSDHGLKLDVPIPTDVLSFPGESNTRIPIWVDINGSVMEDVWSKVVESVLHLLVHAPGCTAQSIERAHDSKLWEWEIDMVLKWMESVGLANRTAIGKDGDGAWKGGWRASESWYCVPMVIGTTSGGHGDGENVEDEAAGKV